MKKIIFFSILSIFLTISMLACGKKSKEENLNKVEEKIVKIETASIREIKEKLIFSCTLEPKEKVDYSIKRGGTAEKILKTNGTVVKKGDNIISFENEDLKAEFLKSKANLEATYFQYKLSKEKFEKFKSLYKKQLISYLEFSNYESAYINSKENYNSARAYYQSLKKLYDDLTVKSTINGIVGNLFLKEGNKIKRDENICSVLNIDEMQAYVSVPARIVSKLKLGEEISVKVEDISKNYKAKITEINPIADMATKNFKIKISIDNKNQELKDGMFAMVTLFSAPKEILVVPNSAILVKELVSYVFVNDEGVAKQITVKTGISDEKYTEILSDELKEGDLIITEGTLGLHENERVAIKKEEDR